MSTLYRWRDLSTADRPSYALICWSASGEGRHRIIKRNGIFMIVCHARCFDQLDAKLSTINNSNNQQPNSQAVTQPQDDTVSESSDNAEDAISESHDNVGVAVPNEPEGRLVNEWDTVALDEEAPTKPFELMKLPYDARHEILPYVCNNQTMAVFLGGIHYARTAVPLPSIARAGDRTLRAECILVSLKQTTLAIHSGPGNAMLQQWLSKVDFSIIGNTSLVNGFDAVHRLSFPYFSRFPHHALPAGNPNYDLRLMTRCRNLRHVEFLFVLAELMHSPNGYTVQKPLSLLRQQYRLDTMLEIFKHGELRTVVLRGPNMGDTAHESLTEMAHWLAEEYMVRANDPATLEDPDKHDSIKKLTVVLT